MKIVQSSWDNYYAIFLVHDDGGPENASTLIASAMTKDMSVEFAKYLGRKYEKQSNVIGLYVRKLFGDIIYAYTVEKKTNDHNNKKGSNRNRKTTK